jgi:hypothetical protein
MLTDEQEDETGEEIVRALKSPNAAPVRAALIGCHFYTEDPDQAEEITVAPTDAPVLIVSRGGKERRLGYALLERGYVIPQGPDLRSALAAARSPRDERVRWATPILARERIKQTGISLDDRIALAEAIEDDRARTLPDAALRHRRYQLFRTYQLDRQGARMLEKWRAMLPAGSAEAVANLIELAASHRRAGQIEQALETTALVTERGAALAPSARAVLACERAAILLDLFERNRDPARLTEARRWAGLAWSIEQSEHISRVYQRLTSLEAGR